ncbi:MAG TPA: BatA and WFA domain-containing protein [Longimicrobiales bacterium]|nr:BatA and WFA domain-containing protein [Longimicrobiales bacterium]
MAFLAPLFLIGALAIAIPVIVHLTHKQREDVQRFPSLMFVRQIPFKSTRKQRIRHWFLLLLRAAALILIAAAFARPFLDKPLPPPPAGTGARELVILLDRSFSMGYRGRWAAAVAAATEALNSVRGNDRATLVFFDEHADAVRAQETDHSALRAALRTAQPGSLGTRYAPAFRLAQSTLQGSARPRREVVLISDLQRSGWNAREAVELVAGTDLRIVDVGTAEADNIAVANVNFARAAFAGRERVTVSARVLNRTTKAASLPITLELNGRNAQTVNLTIPPNQAGVAQFEPFILAGPDVRGVIRAGNDALPADNQFYFVLAAGQAVTASILRAPNPRPEETLFLERALEAPGDPQFVVGVHSAAVPDNALRGGSVVIVNDAVPTGAELRRLRRFVESGGGVLLVLGERSGGWRGEASDLLPGRLGSVVERDPAAPGRLADLQYGHRVFEAFRTPRAGDFTAARFYRYRELSAPDSAVLARFDDGRIALAEKRLGRGRVLAWTSTLDNFWNDVPLQPVFPPFLREAVSFLSGSSGDPAWRTAGGVLDLDPLFGASGTSVARELVVATPSGSRTTMRRDGPAFLALDQQGFYQVRGSGSNGASRTFAVNVSPAESDLARLPEAEVRDAVVPTSQSAGASTEVATTPQDQERSQTVWWYLLAMAAALLAAESIISNRLSRVARA